MIMKEVKSPYELVGYKMFMIGIEIFEHECKQNKKKNKFRNETSYFLFGSNFKKFMETNLFNFGETFYFFVLNEFLMKWIF